MFYITYEAKICLVLCKCAKDVSRMSGVCLEGVRRVSGKCLEGVWKVSGRCLEGIKNHN